MNDRELKEVIADIHSRKATRTTYETLAPYFEGVSFDEGMANFERIAAAMRSGSPLAQRRNVLARCIVTSLLAKDKSQRNFKSMAMWYSSFPLAQLPGSPSARPGPLDALRSLLTSNGSYPELPDGAYVLPGGARIRVKDGTAALLQPISMQKAAYLVAQAAESVEADTHQTD